MGLKRQIKQMDVDGSGAVEFVEYLKVYVKGTYGREVHIGLESVEGVAPPMTAQRSGVVQPELDPITEESSDVTTLKLTKAKSPNFYARTATLFLRGSDDKAPVDKIKL